MVVQFFKKTFKFLIELLIIVYFVLLELAWFQKGVSIQVLHISIKAHDPQKLLLILMALGLLWLFMVLPWREKALWAHLRHSASYGLLALLLGITPIILSGKGKSSLTHGLMGSYYLNQDWSGEPLFRRIDPEISFANHALEEFSKKNYSIVWTGYIRIPRTTEYTFILRSDDGSTLSLDDQLILDNGGLHRAKNESARVRLEEGFHAIKISYFQNDGAHLLHFYWAGPKPFHWAGIVPSRYLYPEKPSFEAYQREQGRENVYLVLKVLWLGIFLFYAWVLYTSKALREAYVIPFLLIGILTLAVLIRLYLLEYPLGSLDSDEAIEGLMAKHILTQQERPILYYYLPYMGGLKAHLAALVFYFFGVSAAGLKGVSAFFFLVFVFLMFIFARKLTDPQTALLTTLILTISPAFLALRSIYAGAAYMEVLAFGTALLVILVKILYPVEFQAEGLSKDSKVPDPLRWYSLAGFLAGVGFWTNPLIIYYLLTFLFFWFLKDKLFIFRRSFVVFLLFFVIGVFPLLIWNLEHQWGTYAFFAGEEKTPMDSQLLQFPANLHNLLTQAFPILVGTHRQYDGVNLVGDLSYVVLGVYLLSFVYALGRYDRSLSSLLRLSLPPRPGLEIPIVLTFVIVLLFCVSKFGTLAQVPRYLLPLYSALPLFLALLLLRIKKSSTVLFVLLLSSVLGANFLGILSIHENSRLKARAFQTFLHILQDRHIRYVSTDYWIAYRITFASNEEIICSPNLGPTPEDKYPAYTQQVQSIKEPAYVAKIGLDKDKELERTLLRRPESRYRNIKYYYSLYYPVE